MLTSRELNLLESAPKTLRNIEDRLVNKEENRRKALEFGFEYFDGPRSQGYGGYHYDGRWIPVARKLVDLFSLSSGDRVLDVGCAKGFLVSDLRMVLPGLNAYGMDISDYALRQAHQAASGHVLRGNCRDLPFADNSFSCVICINTIHNLDIDGCRLAIQEIQRVSAGRAFIQVDAYRSGAEKELFEQWMLTAKTYLTPREWCNLFFECGYTGYYYWTIFE